MRRAYDDGVTAAVIVAVVAAGVAVLASAASVVVLQKVRSHQRLLEREIERGKAAFDEIVAHELALRTQELEHTLARLRADSLSQLAEEERRIAEERRRDVAERERLATERLATNSSRSSPRSSSASPTGRATSASCRRAWRTTEARRSAAARR